MEGKKDRIIIDSGKIEVNYDWMYYVGYLVILLGFLPSIVYYYDLIEYHKISDSGILLQFGVHYDIRGLLPMIYYPIFIVFLILFYKNFKVAKIDKRLYFMIALLVILLIYNMMVPHLGELITRSFR